MRTFTILLGGCLLFALAPRGVAHFRLLEPASWLQESESRRSAVVASVRRNVD